MPTRLRTLPFTWTSRMAVSSRSIAASKSDASTKYDTTSTRTQKICWLKRAYEGFADPGVDGLEIQADWMSCSAQPWAESTGVTLAHALKLHLIPVSRVENGEV